MSAVSFLILGLLLGFVAGLVVAGLVRGVKRPAVQGGAWLRPPHDDAGEAAELHKCFNCGEYLDRHCEAHLIPCCPGKCSRGAAHPRKPTATPSGEAPTPPPGGGWSGDPTITYPEIPGARRMRGPNYNPLPPGTVKPPPPPAPPPKRYEPATRGELRALRAREASERDLADLQRLKRKYGAEG